MSGKISCVTREKLVEMVRAAALEVYDRAEDFVGDIEQMTDMDIWISMTVDAIPEIRVSRSYNSTGAVKAMMK